MLLADRQASLKWAGDFTLPRFRAKLANQYLLHPDVAPGYEELYRSDLGERTISRVTSSSDFGRSLRSTASPSSLSFGGTLATQMGTASYSALSQSRSGASLAEMRTNSSTGSLPGLGQSSSVPTLGLRRMEAQPAAARLGRTVAMDRMRGKDNTSVAAMSPEDRKEKEKEMLSEAMSRKLWAAAHGGEIHIKEFIELRKEDPALQLKTCAVPGMQKALKGGAKIDWKNDEWDGATLLLKAVRTDSLALAEYCSAMGADSMQIDKSGRGAFHWAAIEGNPAMLEFLLSTTSDPQLQNPDSGGDTPLHLAAYHGHLPIIRLLIRHNVDPTQPNALGYNAIDLAEARRMWHIAHYLSEQKHQEEDKQTEDFQVRNLVRPCTLSRANELKAIAALNPKPKPKAAAKKK